MESEGVVWTGSEDPAARRLLSRSIYGLTGLCLQEWFWLLHVISYTPTCCYKQQHEREGIPNPQYARPNST
jgi:hypothetical protein